jgi:hypothetical protein
MINGPKSQHFIYWTELGTSFIVSNVGEFSHSILGSHFKHSAQCTPACLSFLFVSDDLLSFQFSSFVRVWRVGCATLLRRICWNAGLPIISLSLTIANYPFKFRAATEHVLLPQNKHGLAGRLWDIVAKNLLEGVSTTFFHLFSVANVDWSGGILPSTPVPH